MYRSQGSRVIHTKGCTTVFLLESIFSYKVMENVGEARIGLTRTGPKDTAHTVSYRTIDGTAKAGTDYEAGQGQITFDIGSDYSEIKVRIMEDEQWNEDKDFEVLISKNPEHASDDLLIVLEVRRLLVHPCSVIYIRARSCVHVCGEGQG